MSRWLAWIVWCLALALPLQGLAASARLMCHHAAPVSSPPQAAPCHGDDGVAVQVKADQPPAHAGCIACAACHGVAALPSQPPVIAAATPPAAAPAALLPAPALPYITAGPERPPRHPLA